MTLHEPLFVGGIALRNRLVRAPLCYGLAVDARPTPALVAAYGALRGLGLVEVEALAVAPAGLALATQLGLWACDADALAPIAAAVRASGARAVLTLGHAGPRAPREVVEEVPLGASAQLAGKRRRVVREATFDELAEVVAAFAAGARLAREAGFDGVLVDAAHGGLLCDFLSPARNRREDAYGADRTRLLREVLAAVAPMGPVAVRLNAEDWVPGGLDLLGAVEIVRALGPLAYVDVVAGLPEVGRMSYRVGRRPGAFEGYYVPGAARVKALTGAIVASGGGVRSLQGAALAAGSVDLVTLGRPLVREPDLAERWLAGRADAAACESCNHCLERLWQKPLACGCMGE